jgi:chromate transport protein ChrA
MNIAFKSTLVALATQTAILPFVLGRGSLGELLGWAMILGMLFALPSIAVYVPLFVTLNRLNLPRWLTIVLGGMVPLLVAIIVYLPKPEKLTLQNYVFWMALFGGVAGSYALTRLKSAR